MEIIKPRPVHLNMVKVRYNNLHEVFLFLDAYSELKKFDVETRRTECKYYMRDVNAACYNGEKLTFSISSYDNDEGYIVIMPNNKVRYFNASDFHSLFMTHEEKHLAYIVTEDKTLQDQELAWAKNPAYKPVDKVKTDADAFFEKGEDK